MNDMCLTKDLRHEGETVLPIGIGGVSHFKVPFSLLLAWSVKIGVISLVRNKTLELNSDYGEHLMLNIQPIIHFIIDIPAILLKHKRLT